MMPGMPDLQALLQQAQQMQSDMAQTQSELSRIEVTGHAGGGLVTATVTGDGQLKSLAIDPSVVDPADVETLADLIVAAVRDAGRSAAQLTERAMGAVAGGLGGGLGGAPGAGGFDLSAFGLDLLGAAGDEEEDDEEEDDEEEAELDADDEADDDPVTADDLEDDDVDFVDADELGGTHQPFLQQLPAGDEHAPPRVPPIGL